VGKAEEIVAAGAEGAAPQGRATLMLVVVTVVWGLSFSWLKEWQTAADGCPGGGLQASLTFIGLRMTAAFLVVAACMPRLTFRPTLHEHAAGAIVGLVFFLGHVPQVWGLGTTTPALSALFTSLCSAWVPLAAWAYLGERPTAWTVPGFGLAFAGVFAIAGAGPGGAGLDGTGLHFGDWLTLLASVAFTGQVLVLDRLGRAARPGHLTAGFFAVPGLLSLALAAAVAAAGPGVAAWGRWTAGMLGDPAMRWNLVRLTLFPTVLGFTLMNAYQPRVSASRAALIYLLEPLFAAVFSVWQGHDRLTPSLALGGVLILAGNAVLEVPNWLPRRAPAT
jgi:drug/metabolite transporter (DMT)-like permease